MTDLLVRLREQAEWYSDGHGHLHKDAADEIERLQLWIRRIDNINDDPARFDVNIDRACIDALAGKPMIGAISVDQQRTKSEQK